MRILVVHPRMSIMGGGERVAIHSMLAANRMGHEVTLLSEEFDTKRFEDFFGCYGLFDEVHEISYREFQPVVSSKALLYQRLFYYQTQFRRVLRRDRPFDLVLGTQDVGYVPNVSAPVVQYCYFPEYFRHLQTTPGSALWRIYYAPARIFYQNRVNHIDSFFAVSDYTREFVKRVWQRESTTLYPPCPTELYKSTGKDREDLVITTGRIVPEKRMHLFEDVARQLPGIRFLIIGSVTNVGDPYYRSLVEKKPENLSILLSPLRKVREIVAKAKAYVHCAEGEHFGITIVEAMASGCVPVVHDSGGPREIVTPEVGYVWRDPNEAAHQISTIVKDDALQAKLSRAASDRAELFSTKAFESSLIQNLRNYLP